MDSLYVLADVVDVSILCQVPKIGLPELSFIDIPELRCNPQTKTAAIPTRIRTIAAIAIKTGARDKSGLGTLAETAAGSDPRI